MFYVFSFPEASSFVKLWFSAKITLKKTFSKKVKEVVLLSTFPTTVQQKYLKLISAWEKSVTNS
jgi:hypothetical protein